MVQRQPPAWCKQIVMDAIVDPSTSSAPTDAAAVADAEKRFTELRRGWL
jgi:hypothetical protein